MDSVFDLPVYIINQKDRSIEQVFYSYECDTFAIPMIKGLRCRGRGVNAECRLFNNGIAEFFYPLEKYLYNASSRYHNDEVFDWTCIWNKIEPAINAYIDKFQKHIKASKLYMCISIIGAQKALTPSEEVTRDRERMGDIDRDYLICEPIEFSLENECKSGSLNMKRFKLCYLLSLGIRESKEVDQLINEVYP